MSSAVKSKNRTATRGGRGKGPADEPESQNKGFLYILSFYDFIVDEPPTIITKPTPKS
jgi:hypothetical protein